MTKTIAIIGASSRIGMATIALTLEQTDYHLHLFLRNQAKLANLDLPADRVTIFEGSATDTASLLPAIQTADHVFVSLEGAMDTFAKAVLTVMQEAGVSKLTFVTTLGIFNEVPGEFGRWIQANMAGYLAPYQAAVKLIEASNVDYTIIRPGELTNGADTSYVLTERDQVFKGRYCTRRSVAQLALDSFMTPDIFKNRNVGISDGLS